MKNPLASTDRALVAYLISSGVGSAGNVFPFKRSGPKVTPCIIVCSHRGRPTSPACGTYEVEVDILIRTDGSLDVDESEEQPVTENDDLVNRAFEALHKFGEDQQSGQQMEAAINNAAGGSVPEWACLSCEITSVEAASESPGHSITKTESDCWTDTISLRLTVAEANLS